MVAVVVTAAEQAALAVCCKARDSEQLCIFYQTDSLVWGSRPIGGVKEWVDKGQLVSAAANRAGLVCLWHRIALISDAGVAKVGRPR